MDVKDLAIREKDIQEELNRVDFRKVAEALVVVCGITKAFLFPEKRHPRAHLKSEGIKVTSVGRKGLMIREKDILETLNRGGRPREAEALAAELGTTTISRIR